MKYLSTRGVAPTLGFDDVLLSGLAPDGGLYVPETWPAFTRSQIAALQGMSYPNLVAAVAAPFLDGSVADLSALAEEAYAPFRAIGAAHRCCATVCGFSSSIGGRRWPSRTTHCNYWAGCSTQASRHGTLAPYSSGLRREIPGRQPSKPAGIGSDSTS